MERPWKTRLSGQRAQEFAGQIRARVMAEEARLLAHGLVNWICTLSPQPFIMGGEVMEAAELFQR